MVLDKLDNLEVYAGLHPSFPKVFSYLRTLDFNMLPVGKIEVDDSFFINVDMSELKTEGAYLEAHDQYIDIQIPVLLSENVGYAPRIKCGKIRKDERPEKDIVFYDDDFESQFRMNVGSFAILFPQDAHAPLIGKGKTKKLVVKVKI